MKTRSFYLGTLVVLALTVALEPSRAQGVVSEDPNFTPAVLKSGFSLPSGVVFRAPTGDLLLSQQNQVSIVNATSGGTSTFVSIPGTFPDKIDVRSSDGLVAVITAAFGPINFYNTSGTLQDSFDPTAAIIARGVVNSGLTAPTTVVCLSGSVFDTNGNLFVAAGPGSTETGGCLPQNWAVYEFQGPTPWTAAPILVTIFVGNAVIQDMAYAAAKPPAGTLYAINSQNKDVYEISLSPCSDCSIFPRFISNVSTAVNPRGIAIDSLLGDLYVTDFAGPNVFRIPAPGTPGDPSPTIFATGFSNSLRLAFDNAGNLYINETNAGNLWEFTRNSGATPLVALTSGKINTFTFTNPNAAMSDQQQKIMIPATANLGGAAFLRDVFVPVDPSTLNTTLQNGTSGDTSFFGGAPVPFGTTCVQVPSAASSPTHPNCVVVIQQCFDVNQKPFAICPVQELSNTTDLIELSFKWTDPAGLPPNPAFIIGFDDGDGQDLTDITTGSSVDPLMGGGTIGLCSKTLVAREPSGRGDFALTVTPGLIDLTATSSNSAAVTLTSINNFASTITLGVSDVPPGLSATLTATPVNLTAGGTATSTLNVSLSGNTTIAGINIIIGNLLATGCIDNAGIANALTSKVSAAQMSVASGQIPTAINTLTALTHQIQAQSGKHIAASCTTTFPLLVTARPFFHEVRFASANVTFTPATLLAAVVQGIITSLKTTVTTADPITGFVVNSSGVGLQGATLSLLNSLNASVATATTDVTGFYYFATTGTLSPGSTYTIQVTGFPTGFSSATSYPPFTWGGKGLAFNFTVQ